MVYISGGGGLPVTYPDAFHIQRHTIRGNPLVISRLEHKFLVLRIGEPRPKLGYVQLEFVWREELVRQGGEREVEIV